MIRTALIAALAFAGAASFAQDLRVAFPVDCTLGETCYIQNYVDRDPGPGRLDVACGHLSYDGHSGTDIALLSDAAMTAGVNIRAVAPGRVRATRDGMIDITIRAENAPDITGRECGNAVVIDHDAGWSSQYCHLKRGSVAVKSGDDVTPDTVIGQVGLSGRTEFPHLHLTLRKGDAVVDPFNPDAAEGCGAPTRDLWIEDVDYTPAGLISVGFSANVPNFAAIKSGTAGQATLPGDAEALVAWAQVYGSRDGDTLAFRILRPDGTTFLETAAELDQKVRAYRAVGRKLRAAAWRPGIYTVDVRYLRGGLELGRDATQVTVSR